MDVEMDEARVGRHRPLGKASRASAQARKPIAAKKPLTPCSRFGVFQTFYLHKPDRPLMSIEIKIRKNEPVDRALRRMKKKLDRENIIKGVRAKRYYEKPCEKRRRKNKVQAFTQMLRRRYAE
jgi:small subunit ribosomal protein S21